MPQVAHDSEISSFGDVSAPSAAPWAALLDSIQRRRWPGALYYKPACLLAVIDGIEEGLLDPLNLDPQLVLARFQRLVLQVAPERAEFGWRPFWHLGNDGAWSFYKGARRLVPDDYGTERKPNSRGELLNRIDRVSVEPGSLAAWSSSDARAILRQGLVAMLNGDDDPTCSALADLCAIAGKIVENGTWTPIESEVQSRGGQGFLGSAAARRAVERRAMDVVSKYFRNLDYVIDDVSLRMPFDLQCTKASEVLFVEVKGTTSQGRAILLTAGELAFASAHSSQMVLAVVSGIRLVDAAEESLFASGGTLRLFWKWMPEANALSAVSYSYQVPLDAGLEPGESQPEPIRQTASDTSEGALPSITEEQ
jgi:hypothetical protein